MAFFEYPNAEDLARYAATLIDSHPHISEVARGAMSQLVNHNRFRSIFSCKKWIIALSGDKTRWRAIPYGV